VSVREGRAAEVRAWRLREDRTAFDEEDLATVGSTEDVPGAPGTLSAS
jgi:hypothetical protein